MTSWGLKSTNHKSCCKPPKPPPTLNPWKKFTSTIKSATKYWDQMLKKIKN